MSGSLLILGASVRAAAQSAARLGLRAYCGDLFCDADLPDSAVGQVARSFPGDLARIAEQAPPGPWMYAGGLENYPTLVARVSRRHELLGTPPDALRKVRDPFAVRRVLSGAGLQFPECRQTDEGLAEGASWLLKHRRSSGGLRVHDWRGQSKLAGGRRWYLQRQVEGLPIGAVFVAAGGRARLLDASEQVLFGSNDRPFQYGGSIGPVELSPRDRESIVDVGQILAAEFDLKGMFGVDLVVAADGIWTIEVNPRYTASVEVLERAIGFNAVELHLAACRDARLCELGKGAVRCVGKHVVYAERSFEMTTGIVKGLLEQNRNEIWPVVADIPRAPTRIKAGQPVLTVFAEGPNTRLVQEQLRERVHALRHMFGA
jgi:predicted ATP-grasp superfamily ATP-dependent carboligase